MRPRRDSQEQPWGRLLVPHHQIHSTVSLSHSGDTETPSRWEKLRINNANHKWIDSGQLNLKVDTVDSYLPHHQPIRRKSMSWSHPLQCDHTLSNYCLCHYLSQGGMHGPEGTGLLFPSFARQSNKAILFYFTPNSVYEIQFSTSVQRSWTSATSYRSEENKVKYELIRYFIVPDR